MHGTSLRKESQELISWWNGGTRELVYISLFCFSFLFLLTSFGFFDILCVWPLLLSTLSLTYYIHIRNFLTSYEPRLFDRYLLTKSWGSVSGWCDSVLTEGLICFVGQVFTDGIGMEMKMNTVRTIATIKTSIEPLIIYLFNGLFFCRIRYVTLFILSSHSSGSHHHHQSSSWQYDYFRAQYLTNLN